MIICGGVYAYDDTYKNVHEGVCLSVQRSPQGNATGTFAFPGKGNERIEQDSDRFAQLRLIGRPASPKVGRPRKE